MKWEVGKSYRCIKSASCAYTEGNVYECYENNQGHRVLMGDDNLEDFVSLVLSSFKEVTND